MRTRTIAAAEFKAHCLALMDEVARTGDTIVVTKRGKPIAQLVPAVPPAVPDLRGSLLWEAEDAWEPLDAPWFQSADEPDDLPLRGGPLVLREERPRDDDPPNDP